MDTTGVNVPMNMSSPTVQEGGCPCRAVRYRVNGPPLFVHGCHCTWCQRETGSAFAVNALIETDRIEILQGDPEMTMTPSASGAGQKIIRCPACHVALWSHYGMAVGDRIAFLRCGTLDDPGTMPPDIHIFTSTMQHWVTLPAGIPAVPEYYIRRDLWPSDSLERFNALKG